jgi:hypothetical protein
MRLIDGMMVRATEVARGCSDKHKTVVEGLGESELTFPVFDDSRNQVYLSIPTEWETLADDAPLVLCRDGGSRDHGLHVERERETRR